MVEGLSGDLTLAPMIEVKTKRWEKPSSLRPDLKTPSVEASSEGGSSTRAQLVAFALGLVLPILAFVGLVLLEFAASERARVEQSALDKARNTALAIDR